MSSITITIKSSGDAKYEVSVDTSITVADLKKEIAAQALVPAESQRLIYSGKVLKDADTVASYKIQSGHTVHMVKGATAKPPQAAAQTPTEPQNTATGSSGVPSNIAAGQGAFNPLADLTGARYAGYTQLPSASMFGPDGGMNSAMPDPDQLSDMMSNPQFQQSMQQMLSDPQMLDFMIQQNPQLRAMGPQAREMLLSPMFRQMLSNPQAMRSMMELNRLMGGGFGGAGGAGGFPAPGANPTLGENAAGDANTGGNAASNANPFASMFPGGGAQMDPFALFGGQGAVTQQPEDTRPPEERYASQLSQLNDMGFFDFDTNVAALRRSGGNVQGAIEYLLSNI